MIRAAALGLAALALSGCVSTVASVVTAPVKAAAKVVDWTTTSQDEADRARGREERRREERVGALARDRDRAQARCDRGDRAACATVDELNLRIRAAWERPPSR